MVDTSPLPPHLAKEAAYAWLATIKQYRLEGRFKGRRQHIQMLMVDLPWYMARARGR